MGGARADAPVFTLEYRESAGLFEVTFAFHGDSPVDAIIRRRGLRNGRPRNGDGCRLDGLARDVRFVLFDGEKIDRRTIAADMAIDPRSTTGQAFFLAWPPRTAGGRPGAIGLVINYDPLSGFHAETPIESDEAITYMIETGMIKEGDVMSATASGEAGRSHFTQLHVAGFRGFAAKRSLSLAEPTGSSGSGLTIIVGANNSGKSTFLEALHTVAQGRNTAELSFPQPRRHHELDAVSIELERSDGRSLRVETVNAGGSQAVASWLPLGAGPTKFDIHVTPSRRQFSPYFGLTGTTDRDWGLTQQEFSRTELREQFVGRLRKVDRDKDARVVFDDLLQQIVGDRLAWTIDEIATGQQFLKLIEPGGAWHTSEGLGDGLVSLLFIVDALYDSEPGSLIAIDEPELSLHPQLVRRLSRVLSRYAADRQIVVATHSPLLIDWSDIANGANVARAFKIGGHTEIAQASRRILKKVAKLADTRNLSNPHTVGTVAREAFFLEDGVILTEGQDDVAYLPRIIEDLGLPSTDNVYGWGSGGAGNIPTLAQLFLELGFSKIGAILDDDGEPGTIASLEKLRKMPAEVLTRQIPAPDIRFKEAQPAKSEVRGLLDADNTHVRSESREDAARVLREILRHVARDDATAAEEVEHGPDGPDTTDVGSSIALS